MVGAAAIGLLVVSLNQAQRAGYFVNRVDLSLHGLVIVDLAIEAIAFEVFRTLQPYASAELFHDNANFVGCAILFVSLVGGYRWWSLSAERRKHET